MEGSIVEQVAHFISTVGFPIALLLMILFALWFALKTVMKQVGPGARKWFDAQTDLTASLKQSTERLTENVEGLSEHAKHGHKAFHHTIDGAKKMADGHAEEAKVHFDKAQDALLE